MLQADSIGTRRAAAKDASSSRSRSTFDRQRVQVEQRVQPDPVVRAVKAPVEAARPQRRIPGLRFLHQRHRHVHIRPQDLVVQDGSSIRATGTPSSTGVPALPFDRKSRRPSLREVSSRPAPAAAPPVGCAAWRRLRDVGRPPRSTGAGHAALRSRCSRVDCTRRGRPCVVELTAPATRRVCGRPRVTPGPGCSHRDNSSGPRHRPLVLVACVCAQAATSS